MRWKCGLGLHTPSLITIARKRDRLHALCEGCGAPLERNAQGRWKTGRPLIAQAGSAGKAA